MARNSKYMPYVFYEVNKFPFVETNTKIRQDFYSCHGCNFTILL